MAPTTTDPQPPDPPPPDPTSTWSDDPTAADTDWTQALPPPPPSPGGSRPARPRPSRRSGALLVIGISFAAVSVGYGCLVLLDLLAWETTTVNRSFDGVERIVLDNRCGGASVIGDQPAGGPTTVERKVREGIRAPSADEVQSGSTLRLDGACPVFPQTFTDITYEVHVPPDVAVEGRADGALHLTEIRGPIDVRSGDGGLDVTGARSGVTAHTSDGSIDVIDSSGPLVLSSGSGSIRVERTSADSISTDTGNGSITLDLFGAPDRIEADSGNGSIEVVLPADSPPYAVTTDAGSGSVADTIRSDPAAPRTLVADTGNGGITLRLRDDG